MPRTTTLECPGCPSLRALTFDALGLIKVIEAKGSQGGAPRVVERWGELDSSKCVLAASINDCKDDPLLAVARKTGMIEVLSAINGNICFTVSNANEDGPRPEDDAVVGLHLFAGQKLGLTSRSCTLLTCTTKGNTSMRSIEVTDSPAGSASIGLSNTWSVCNSGNILCSKVDGSEKYAIFGGKGVEMNMWDLNNCTKIWAAKSPPKNSLDIFTPTWFTSSTFLSKDDYRKIVAGTNSHQVRLYDISAQRRPVISFDFRETPIKSVTEDLDGYTVYVGNGSGDLASFDMRTGKLLGCFLGKCSGSIRSIARHPELPVIASCGLDSYLRFWDIKTQQLLSAVFLKQHLTNVVFDSNFADEESEEPEVKMQSLTMLCPGRPDLILPIPFGNNSKRILFTLKEGSQYRLKFSFTGSNNIVLGLKYTNVVWKTGMKVDNSKRMLGTFSPQQEPYMCEMEEETTPSSTFARGTYSARTKFVDDDGKCYLDVCYYFEIQKNWPKPS